MSPLRLPAPLACLAFAGLVSLALPSAQAADATAARPVEEALPRAVPEPVVQRTVIEDDRARIEELKVRGQTVRIAVQPKVGPKKGYEIVTGGGLGTEPPEGGGNDLPSARGRRVWNVLSF